MFTKRRRIVAVTLVEALLMTMIALGIMAAAYNLLRRSGSLMDSTTHSIDLQVGVRNLLEHMVRDMGSCLQVVDPTPLNLDPKRNLVLIKAADDEVQGRLSANTSMAFPFMESSGPTTTQKMPAKRVSFSWDSQSRKVSRKEEAGVLTAETDAASPSQLSRFTFAPSSVLDNRPLATSVETLYLHYVGYDPTTGELEQIASPGDPSPLGYEKTAAVAVRINAQFDEGLYGFDRSMPKIEMLTKIWSIKRRSDEVYKEYFSSTDEDLRW